jgi:hypothetical protein
VQTATIHHSQQAREAAASPAAFPSLELETRPAVGTAAAAHYLNRQPQTLRGWASAEDGPLRPLRINSRLAWRTADIRALLGVA